MVCAKRTLHITKFIAKEPAELTLSDKPENPDKTDIPEKPAGPDKPSSNHLTKIIVISERF